MPVKNRNPVYSFLDSRSGGDDKKNTGVPMGVTRLRVTLSRTVIMGSPDAIEAEVVVSYSI